jgi:hypothetical protein
MWAEVAFRRRLEQLVGALDPGLQVAECDLTAFATYTIRLEHGGERGQPLAVPIGLLQGLLREDPIALRIVSGVLALNARALQARTS